MSSTQRTSSLFEIFFFFFRVDSVILSTAFNSDVFCDNCSLWSLCWLVESNSYRQILWSAFLTVVSYDVARFDTWGSFNSQGKVTVITVYFLLQYECWIAQWRCLGAADICCVSLVSHYLNDIPCKNYNCIFLFVKVMHEILLVPFFTDTVYKIACLPGFWFAANYPFLVSTLPTWGVNLINTEPR